MSDILLSLLLGLIQGLTEFLPVSSSAHLILPGLIFSYNDLGLSFDIAVHAGTLMAVIYFFRSELALMTKSVFINEGINDKYKQLFFNLIIATLPIIFIGFILADLLEQRVFSEKFTIAVSNLLFAGVLLIAFMKRKANKNLFEITIFGALLIGLFQCFALIPGISLRDRYNSSAIDWHESQRCIKIFFHVEYTYNTRFSSSVDYKDASFRD